MASDDSKDETEDKAQAGETPVAKATRARTRSAKTAAAKPQAAGGASAADAEVKPASGESGSDAPETQDTGEGTDAPAEGGFRLHQSSWALAAVFAAVILLVLLLAWPGGRSYLAGLLGGSEPAAVAALTKRLAALETRLAALDKDIAGLKAGTPEAKVAAEARAALDQRITALEGRTGGETLGARVDALDKRVDGLVQTVAGLETRLAKAEATDPSTTLTVMALAGALRTGGPFAKLAARVGAAAGEDAGVTGGLKALQPYAAKGVPTVPALAARVETLGVPTKEPAAPKPAAPAAGGGKPAKPTGFWAKVKANILKLGRIRKTPEGPSAPEIAVTVRAATAEALLRGDLGSAREAAKDLTGPKAAAWRRDLGARIRADRLALRLDRLVAGRLTGRTGKP